MRFASMDPRSWTNGEKKCSVDEARIDKNAPKATSATSIRPTDSLCAALNVSCY